MGHIETELFAEFADERLGEAFRGIVALVHPPFAVDQFPALLEASRVGQLRCP